MARQFDSEDPSAEVTVVDETTAEIAENASTEQVAEQAASAGTVNTADASLVESVTEGTEQPEKPAEEVDYEKLFEGFKDEVLKAIKADEGRDADTGTLAAVLIEPVRASYAGLNTRTRTVARDWIQAQMSDAMTGSGDFEETDFTAARSLMELLTAVKTSAPKPTVEKKPVDPTEAHVARIVALMLSPNLVAVPEGVASNWQQLVQQEAQKLGPQVIAYRDWLAANADKPTEEQEKAPEVSPIVMQAAQIARGRAVAGRKPSASKGTSAPKAPRAASSGVRRDIAAHIREAFAEHPSGHFLSIGEICKFRSTEYGDDSPSQGAVAARLYPNKQPVTLEAAGVKAEIRDSKGAVKL